MKKLSKLKKILSIALATALAIATIPLTQVSAEVVIPSVTKNYTAANEGTQQVIEYTISGKSTEPYTIKGTAVTLLGTESSNDDYATAIAAALSSDEDWDATSEGAVVTLTAKEAAADVEIPALAGFTTSPTPSTTTHGAAPTNAKTTFTVTQNIDDAITFWAKYTYDGTVVWKELAFTASKTNADVAAGVVAAFNNASVTASENVITVAHDPGDADVATLEFIELIKIATDATDTEKEVGETATFTVAVENGTDANFTYQWQISDASAWDDITDETDATLSLEAVTLAMNGYKYRCVIKYKDTVATKNSAEATLTVTPAALAIKTQPQNTSKAAGEMATFTVEAEGGTTPYTYQWQVSTNGGTGWSDITAATNATATTDTLSFVTTEDMTTYQYKCVVTDSAGSAATKTSDAATLTVTEAIPLAIKTQPTATTVTAGETAEFTVEAKGGTAPYSYQWQINTTPDEWDNITGNETATTATLSLTATEAMNGKTYRCLVNDSATSVAAVTSNEVTLIVTAAEPDTEPAAPTPVYIAPATNHNPDSFPTSGIGDGLNFTAPTSWYKLVKAAKAMADGETLTITTGNSSRIDKSVLKAIMGMDKNLKIICGNSFIWGINGNDITKARTVNLYAAYVNATEEDEEEFDGLTTVKLRFSSNRTLGCSAALTISDLEDYDGQSATLYMKKNGYVKVSSGTVENGEVVLDGIKYTTNSAVLVIE